MVSLPKILQDMPVAGLMFMADLVHTYDSSGVADDPLGIVNVFEEIVRRRGQFLLVETEVEAEAVRAFLEEYRNAPKHLVPKGNGWFVYRNPARESEAQG